MVLSEKRRVLFIQDYERICRGEVTFERAAFVLNIQPEDKCYYLDFEHGRICVATVRITQSPFVIVRVQVGLVDSRDLYFHHRP